MANILKKIYDNDRRELKKFEKLATKVESLGDEYEKLSDEQLQAKTPEFRKRLENGETLDDILPEAFATAREGAKRVLGLYPFHVQIIGGIALHYGNIAEMMTGEGKTLTATLPVYLNALTGKGVHVVTVNEYLSSRDESEMGQLYKWLGLSVGLNLNSMSADEKRDAYNCDVTYSTNSELGFDYLRDNMVVYKDQMVQRPLNYAIIDEVDSILIDEARTPLIISGQAEQANSEYIRADRFVKTLVEDKSDDDVDDEEDHGDYKIDWPTKTINLTNQGIKKACEHFGLKNLYDIDNQVLVHHIDQALRANYIMLKDIDYVVQNGEVMIVDSFTGRVMEGRRYSDGLHQAIEAKEGVKIQEESKTQATITYQNFFRMYKKLAGMTGTAKTEEEEFREIYNMEVITIPTNRPIARKDLPDILYPTLDSKFEAVVKEIKERHAKGQPVLVGTVAIESSERLSQMLNQAGIPHAVLNAKNHAKEAEIIMNAGQRGAVTIATNMAGRGTDIMLGGNSEYLAKEEMRKNKVPENLIEESNTYYETDDQDILRAREQFNKLVEKYDEKIKEEKQKVIDAGGLKIIGTERHESRRIDNQLRGRSGRQGDVGESRFFIGLDDDLMKIFGGDAITKVYNTLGADEDMPIASRLISKAVENAQKKVEGRNFSIRKNVLKYDDVMNAQREIIYKQRREVLDGEDIHSNILNMINSVAEETVAMFVEGEDGKSINIETLNTEITNEFGLDMYDFIKAHENDSNAIIEELEKQAVNKYQVKEEEITSEKMRELERVVMLKVVDEKWMNHIDDMDELKNGIGLRAYGQQDPVVKYRMEGMDMFDEMIANMKVDVVKILMNIRRQNGEVKRQEAAKITGAALEAIESVDGGKKINTPEHSQTVVNEGPKVGRNDPCPCGSGKKYKNCCGKNQ